ncbi:MAG: ABC transporter permease [Clostridiales bacterium]|jgi:ABC-2 type transport system permease protein|nr:ABC transporter permease [Clostridiales bacterium]
MTAIINKELRMYFYTMIGYVCLGFFVLITALFFLIININYMDPDFSAVLSSSSLVFLIFIPILTMRMFAEESKQKTDQLLYTSPLKVSEIVLGKYFAALILFLIGMAITAIMPLSIAAFAEGMPAAKIIGAYVGYILLGACFISIGLFASTLTDNQIAAAVVTFALSMFFFILSPIAEAMPSTRPASVVFLALLFLALSYYIYSITGNIYAGAALALLSAIGIALVFFLGGSLLDGAIAKILTWFSLVARFENFSKGVLNLSDLVYYLTFLSLFVYLTIHVIEKRRWK